MSPIQMDAATGRATLTNARLELVIDTQPFYNPGSLRDAQSGWALADAEYAWSDHARAALAGAPEVSHGPDGASQVVFRLKKGGLAVTHAFTLPADQPDVLIERLTLSNPGPHTVDTSTFGCGFAKRVRAGQDWLPEAQATRLCELPYRYHPESGEKRDFTIAELLQSESWYSPVRSQLYRKRPSTAYGSEAWAWYRDGMALLVSKYNSAAMEWSILEPVKRQAGQVEETLLRFGGAARWKLGDPEGAASLAPGASFSFGETRYRLVAGGWPAAMQDLRGDLDRKGHRLPAGYNPPVHWNELYDNPYWWRVSRDPWHLDRPELRAELYNLLYMQIEIDKARAIGCECFYLDPGWDTDFASSIWDEQRLGPQADFARRLKQEYGMELALHTPLAPWSNNASYPLEARQMASDEQRRDDLCVASAQYIELKVARLRELVKNGAYFLMFDGSWYDQPCYDASHGHGVPSTRQEHLDAILKIAQGVHAAYPHAVIEQHDPITGPGTPRYTPTYFMHGQPGAFDELWGFEYMINALDDLSSRRAFSLFYYNLAYSIPVYLHFDLRSDNANALGFWWFASTCRHLGFGGQHADPRVWAAHRQAMQTYLAHKRFFTQGIFSGPDELTHLHCLPEAGACVINCFNLEPEPETRRLRLPLADLGLAGRVVTVTGAAGDVAQDVLSLTVSLPGLGHQLVKVSAT